MLKNLGDWNSIKDYFQDIADRLDLKKISEADLAAEFGQKSGKTGETVQKELDAHAKVNVELVAYIEELKKNGYKIGLISNGHVDSFERYIFAEHPNLRALFDHMTISSEVGMLKPHPEIYMHALENLGSTPEESVFIDDNEKNTAGADAVGITGILYTDVSSLKESLKNLGIA